MSNPSLILTNTKFGNTVTFKLYGELTPDRITEAERLLTHRAEQVSPVRAAVERVIPVPERRRPSYRDDEVFDGPFQSTGR